MVASFSYSPLVRIHLVGDLAISPHGIFTALGFLVGAWFFLRDTRRLGLPDAVVKSILTRAAIGALAGARFSYVVNNLGSFSSPLEWFAIWEGGISLLGGLVGALIVAWADTRRRGLDFVALVDRAAPWLPLGIAVGRVGDIVIADHLGRTTSSPIGFRCPDFPDVGRNVGSACPPGEPVHLTAGYDLMASVAICVVLLVWRRRRTPTRRGEQSLLLAGMYGLNRFALDFLRDDPRRFGLTGSQWAAAVVVIAAGALLILAARRRAAPVDVRPDREDPASRRSRPPGHR